MNFSDLYYNHSDVPLTVVCVYRDDLIHQICASLFPIYCNFSLSNL